MPKGRGIRVAQAEATRAVLLRAARRLFTEKGFHATSTLEIVQAAGVTRGALQHHFPHKEDLFRAVFEQAGRGMVEATARRVATEGWPGLIEDLKDYLARIPTLEEQRISFIDGPAVLGWAEWRKLHTDYALRMFETAVGDGIARGLIRPQPPRALAHLILSIVEESSLMVLNAIDLEITRAEVEMAILSLLSAIEPGGRRQPESRRETDRGRTERQGRQARHTG